MFVQRNARRLLAGIITFGISTAVHSANAQDLFVVNTLKSQVGRFSAADGYTLHTFADDSKDRTAYLTSVAFGPDGNLYVGDAGNGTIKRYDGVTGAFLANAVTGLNNPKAFVFDGAGSLYILQNTRVDKVNAASGTVLNTYAVQHGGYGITLMPNGSLLISGNYNGVPYLTAYDAVTGVATPFSTGPTLGTPWGITPGSDGRYYFNDITGSVNVVAPTGGAATMFVDGTHINGVLTNNLVNNYYLTFNGGKLFVTNASDNTVKIFSAATGSYIGSFTAQYPNGITIRQGTVSGTLTFEGISAGAAAQNVTFTFTPTDGSAAIVRTASVAPSGAFSVPFIPGKAYTLKIKGDRSLATTASVDTSAGNVSGITSFQAAGDANNDNVVNFDDFTVLIAAFGSKASETGGNYDAATDFNGDGLVDFDDFLLLLNNFGSRGAN